MDDKEVANEVFDNSDEDNCHALFRSIFLAKLLLLLSAKNKNLLNN